MEVLTKVSEGCHTKEIATNLHIQSSTVATHLRSIYEKLQVNTRAGAPRIFAEQNGR